MSFSASDFNVLRVAAAAPELRVADIDFNASQLLAAMEQASDRGGTIRNSAPINWTSCSARRRLGKRPSP